MIKALFWKKLGKSNVPETSTANDVFYTNVFSFLKKLSKSEPFIIGGLPRAGTSSCERILHSADNCFVADEFHGLSDSGYLNSLKFLNSYPDIETNVWVDECGLSWRELSRSDLHERAHILQLATLLAYTRPSKFAGKDPTAISHFGVKLPSIENAFPQLEPLLSKNPIPFIYCARNPTDILFSHWQMPWVTEDNPKRFAESVLADLRRSIDSFRAIARSGSPVFIWKTPISYEGVIQAAHFLNLARSIPTRLAVVDEWPRERRRTISPISDVILADFSVHEIVQEYRAQFLASIGPYS